MELAGEIDRLLRTAESVEAGAKQVMLAVLAKTATTSGTLHLLNPETQLLELVAACDIPEVVLAKIQKIPLGKGMAGVAVAEAKPVTTCNLQEDDARGVIRQGARETGARGAIAIPLLRGTAAVGALGVATKEPRDFTRAEIEELLAIGSAIAISVAAR